MMEKLFEKVEALEINEEIYIPYRKELPSIEELREWLNDESSATMFRIWETLNGIVIMKMRREVEV